MRLELVEIRYDDPVVQELTREVQAEYGRRYGGSGDPSPMDAVQFVPPAGVFLVGMLGEEPAAMGGWRWGGAASGDAEIKRMYVREPFRRSGLARLVLNELERTAAGAGVQRLVLVTGNRQPEAVALYQSAGYVDDPALDDWISAPYLVHLAKALRPDP